MALREGIRVSNSEIRNLERGAGSQNPVKDFTDLQAWKLARELRQHAYRLTRRFPGDEKHVLVAQIRRAAISITANIAEGYGRFSYQENLQFCRQARGSAFEVRDHMTTALDAGYVDAAEWKQMDGLAQRAIQVLNGYIRATRALQGEAKKVR